MVACCSCLSCFMNVNVCAHVWVCVWGLTVEAVHNKQFIHRSRTAVGQQQQQQAFYTQTDCRGRQSSRSESEAPTAAAALSSVSLWSESHMCKIMWLQQGFPSQLHHDSCSVNDQWKYCKCAVKISEFIRTADGEKQREKSLLVAGKQWGWWEINMAFNWLNNLIKNNTILSVSWWSWQAMTYWGMTTAQD